MQTKVFARHIRHLDQADILTGAISSLNKLLVDKRLIQERELQDYFLEWMRQQKLTGRNGKGKKPKAT